MSQMMWKLVRDGEVCDILKDGRGVFTLAW